MAPLRFRSARQETHSLAYACLFACELALNYCREPVQHINACSVAKLGISLRGVGDSPCRWNAVAANVLNGCMRPIEDVVVV